MSATDISIPSSEPISPTSCITNLSGKTSAINLNENNRIENENRLGETEVNTGAVSCITGLKRARHKDYDRPIKATLGIRQIWVHNDHRRKSVARCLVDAARKSFIFGSIVMRCHTAYSQPTTDGLNFALAYSQDKFIWTYK